MSTTLSSPEPLAVGEQNPFDLLADESTVDAQLNRSNDLDESKQDDSSSRRFGKDDMKEQAYQARTQIKAKATDLKEQVVQSDTVQRGSQTIQQGVDSIKQKSSDIQQSIPSKQDLKDKAADLQSSIPSAQDLKDKAVDLQQSIPNAQQLKSKVVDLKDDLMQSESVKLASHKIQEGIDTIKEKAGLKEDQEEEQTSSPIEKDSSIKAKSAKGKAADLKAQASDAINQGVDMAKSKAADLKQSIPSTADAKVMMQQGIDAVKEKAADIQQSIPSKDELKGKAADLKQSASKKAADVKDQAIDSETIASAKAKYQQSVDAAKEKITDAQKAAPSKKDQAADSNIVQRGSKVVQDGIDTAKAKATDLKQSIPSTQDIKSKAADLQSQIPSTQDLKGKASDLKDQVMNSEIVAQASQKVQQGIDAVKGKANDAGSKKSTPKGKTKSLKAQASDAIDQGVAKANDLKDQIVNSDAMASASATIQQGIDTVKAKAADIQQSLPSKQDVKEKAANLQSQIPSKDEVKGKAQQLKQDASSKVSQATNSSVHSNPNEHVKVFPSKRLSAHTKAEIQSKAGDLKAQGQQAVKQGLDAAKEQVGLEKDATNEELVDEVQSQASEKMTEIKQRGAKVLSQAASKINQTLDANLSDEQKAKIDSGIQQAKQATAQAAAQGKYWIDYVLRGPLLRPVGTFIRRHNLQLPATIFLSFAGLWLGLTLIRLVTTQTHPHKPEIDIHSKEATMDWLRYHSGDLKGKAIDMRESLSGRAASFLANHEYDAMKSKAIDWKEIGMHKLGLTEPTWGEWAWAKLTGRPITWEDRVDSILNLAKKGVADRAADLSKYSAASLIGNMKDSVKSAASNLQNKAVPEPTLQERAAAMLHNMRTSLSTAQPELSTVDSIKSSLRDSVDSIRSRLPGSVGGLSAEEMKQRAYDATHQSTLGSIKSGAEYVKNRILHGSQEAAHVAQDRANELADKAKYKAGL